MVSDFRRGHLRRGGSRQRGGAVRDDDGVEGELCLCLAPGPALEARWRWHVDVVRALNFFVKVRRAPQFCNPAKREQGEAYKA